MLTSIYQEAKRLCWLYHSQAQFYFGPVNLRQINEELLPCFYPECLHSTELPKPGAHDLALLFMIFCFGCLMDTTLPFAPDNQPAE